MSEHIHKRIDLMQRFLISYRVRSLQWNAFTENVHLPRQQKMVYFGIVVRNLVVIYFATRRTVECSQMPLLLGRQVDVPNLVVLHIRN